MFIHNKIQTPLNSTASARHELSRSAGTTAQPNDDKETIILLLRLLFT